jgi:hypothetical protein
MLCGGKLFLRVEELVHAPVKFRKPLLLEDLRKPVAMCCIE